MTSDNRGHTDGNGGSAEEAMRELLVGFARFCESVNVTANTIGGKIASAVAEYEPMFQQIVKDLSLLNEGLKIWADAEGRLDIVLLELGWPPPMQLTPRQAIWIVREFDEKGVEAARGSVEQYLLEFYDASELARMTSRWRMGKRFPILEQAVQAHIEGKYWVSIPAILPQIEGLVAERTGHTTWTVKLDTKVRECFEGKSHWSSAVIRDFCAKVIAINFTDWRQPPPSFLNRHSILHGHDTDYGTAANSLKAILVFDYLHRYLATA